MRCKIPKILCRAGAKTLCRAGAKFDRFLAKIELKWPKNAKITAKIMKKCKNHKIWSFSRPMRYPIWAAFLTIDRSEQHWVCHFGSILRGERQAIWQNRKNQKTYQHPTPLILTLKKSHDSSKNTIFDHFWQFLHAESWAKQGHVPSTQITMNSLHTDHP